MPIPRCRRHAEVFEVFRDTFDEQDRPTGEAIGFSYRADLREETAAPEEVGPQAPPWGFST